jgi:ATP-dependent helicase/DNAse subunit B
VPEVSATELESYSQCGLLGLAQGRWRLRDEQEADADLWPQYRGILLHKAVELLLAKKVATAEDALELAWDLVRPRGLLKSPRLEKQIRSSLLETLEKFLHLESAYQERSGAKPFLLEGSDSANQAEPLRLEFSEGTVVGRSDRIDEVNDGLFVMDYKSSAQSIAGRDMVEKGYRLQLPFYALAAARRYEKPVLGAQFVELTTAGARSRGILFSEFNGKGPGKLTNSMARASLFKEPPEEIWARCELQIRDHVKRYVGGVFEAKPKNAKDCDRCRYQDLCGKRRLIETEETVEESSGGAVGE